MSSWFNIYTPLLRHKAQLLHPSPRASNCSPPWFAQDRVAPCSSLPPQRLHPSIPSPPTQPTLLQLCSLQAPNSLLFLMSDFPFPLIFSWKGEELRFYPTSTSSSLLCGSPLLSDGPPSSLPLATVVLGRGELSCGSRQVWFRGPALWWLRPFPLGTDHHLEQKLYDSSGHRGKEQITFFHLGSKSLIKDFLGSESPGVLGFCPFCDCFFSLLLDSMTSTIAFHNSRRHT